MREPNRPSEPSTLPDIVINNDHTPAPEREPKQFKASKNQRAYLDAWLDPTAPKTITGIAKVVGVSRKVIYDWQHNDHFNAWFNAEVERATEHLWQPLLNKLLQLGMQGSVEHAKLLAQIRGAIRPADDGPGTRGVTVIVGVPRSGDAAPLPPADPRPALPPAPTSSSEH